MHSDRGRMPKVRPSTPANNATANNVKGIDDR